jgi:hypothetical protein
MKEKFIFSTQSYWPNGNLQPQTLEPVNYKICNTPLHIDSAIYLPRTTYLHSKDKMMPYPT